MCDGKSPYPAALAWQDDFGGRGGAIYNEGSIVVSKSAVFSRNLAEASGTSLKKIRESRSLVGRVHRCKVECFK